MSSIAVLNAVRQAPLPVNEPIKSYAPGSPERAELKARLQSMAADRIEIPLFERVELFARGLGESSDAVEKEMFQVAGARGSDEERAEWALRPEPTAGIVRAFIEHGMHVRPGPLRLTMIGPM